MKHFSRIFLAGLVFVLASPLASAHGLGSGWLAYHVLRDLSRAHHAYTHRSVQGQQRGQQGGTEQMPAAFGGSNPDFGPPQARPRSENGGLSPLPNRRLTPGATDPRVTQANLEQTICHPGYTRTIRPPVAYTERLKREGIAQYGYADRRLSHYEEDHLVSLELGGSATSPANLWPEPHQARDGWGSYTKDQVENRLHALVCAHRLSLRQAQYLIATNWIEAYQRYVSPRPVRGHVSPYLRRH